MLRSITFLCRSALALTLVPVVWVGAACSDGASTTDSGSAGTAGNAASGGASAAGGVGAFAGNGGTGHGAVGGNSAAAGNGDAAGDSATGDSGAGGTASANGPDPVSLGSAEKYVVIAESMISNVPTSVVTGDVVLSSAAASYITGFALTKAGTKWTSPQVVGSVFAADNDPPTPIDLTTAVADMSAAYTDAAGRPTPKFLNLGGGAIGGLTLAPGLYKWTSTVTVPSDVALAGSAEDTWIFQVTGDLKMSAAKAMTLSGGALAKNIVWQVAGKVELGVSSHLEGIVLSKTAITLGTGATVNGRLFAQTAVNLAGSTVTAP